MEHKKRIFKNPCQVLSQIIFDISQLFVIALQFKLAADFTRFLISSPLDISSVFHNDYSRREKVFTADTVTLKVSVI